MNKNTLKKWADNPWRIAVSFSRRGWLNWLPDKAYLSIMYRASFKKKINWKSPKTFNEKLQWLKIYNRNPAYSLMVDKYDSKKLVSSLIGEAYVIPTIGGPWNSFDEIDFDVLPEQFVIKTTHDCGGVLVCKDKSILDKSFASAFFQKHLQRNYYFHCREWPYKHVVPRIFVEKYVSDRVNAVLPVYKIFCFQGEPKIIQAILNDKKKNETVDYFDIHWNRLNIKQGFPNSEKIPACPQKLEEMLHIAEVLSKGHTFIRIDLYEADDSILFSEYTFYSDAGFASFEPSEWDDILGSWIKLPGSE